MTFAEAARPLEFVGRTDTAVLLIHGFTSTPGTLADWAAGLNRTLGVGVSVPLLPGHGTRWQDLNQVSWRDWEATVIGAFDALATRYPRVAVGGLSLGGALACLVAARRPQARALLLVNHLMWLGNPALPLAPLIRRLTPSLKAVAGDIKKSGVVEPAYDRVPTRGVDEFRRLLKVVRPLLPSLRLPTLLMKSRDDHVVPVASTLKTLERLGSTRKDLLWLEHSYHVATLDHDLPLVVQQSDRFLLDVLGESGKA